MMQQQGSKRDWRAAILLLLLLCAALAEVMADPMGAGVVNVTPALGGPAITPSNRSDARGTITTILLNSTTQTARWKAYVGNISGSFALRNPAGDMIYDWDIAAPTGQVYASRWSSITWTGMTCADQATIVSESTFNNMTSTPDSMNATFNWTIHKEFRIGSSTTIAQNTCNSTVTYVSGARQAPTVNSPYQEILIKDTNSYLVYLADISNDGTGYDGTKYDFQMLVAESDIKASPTPYYFYIELR